MIFFEIVALVGIVNVLTRSYLLQAVRDEIPWQKAKYAANCPQCTGVWVGAIYYLLVVCPYNSPRMLIDVCLWAGMISLMSSFVVSLLDYISFAKSALIEHITSSEDVKNREAKQDE